MINPLYHIQNPEGTSEANQDCHVILQLDTNALFYVLMKKDKLLELKYFRLETSDQDSYLLELEGVLDEIKSNVTDLHKTVIIFNWPDSSLVPNEYYAADTNREIIEMIHGDLQKGTILSEEVKEWNLHNVYRIPSELHELKQKRYPDATIWHFNTPWLQTAAGTGSGLKVIVLPGQIMVLLTHAGKLLISQRFPYETDDDIYFYLLSLLQKFELKPNETALEVSGFILKESGLLTTLRGYFPLMILASSAQATGQFPSHFFSPILNLAKCVS